MILMYHHVAPLESIPGDPGPDEAWHYNHSPAGFERQLRRLQRRGFHFESLSDCVGAIRETGAEPPGVAQLTFDDGWLDNYQYALPILRDLGITATFFVTTEHLHRGMDDPRKMTRDQLRELVDAGMTIGGHTRSHVTLTRLNKDEAMNEIAGCKEDLESALDITVDLFAYPGGAFDAGVARMVSKAGYTAACSVIGPARNDASSIYWMYRDVLSEEMNSLHDRYRLSPLARSFFEFRVKRRIAHQLED